MSLDKFFAKYPVFHYGELRDYLSQEAPYNETTLKTLVQYHINKQHIARIYRGYYAVVSDLKSQGTITEDPLLIAGRFADDSIIAYHSALSYHAMAYTILDKIFFLTKKRASFEHSNLTYRAINHPSPLKTDNYFVETKLYDRQGLDIRVTSVERTLVDCLHKPQFSGGWEEIWRAADMINFVDSQHIIDYALLLKNASTIAKLGFYLEHNQAQLNVDESTLKILEKKKPKSTHYMTKDDKYNRHVKRWNLMVPEYILNRDWEEPYNANI